MWSQPCHVSFWHSGFPYSLLAEKKYDRNSNMNLWSIWQTLKINELAPCCTHQSLVNFVFMCQYPWIWNFSTLLASTRFSSKNYSSQDVNFNNVFFLCSLELLAKDPDLSLKKTNIPPLLRSDCSCFPKIHMLTS